MAGPGSESNLVHMRGENHVNQVEQCAVATSGVVSGDYRVSHGMQRIQLWSFFVDLG